MRTLRQQTILGLMCVTLTQLAFAGDLVGGCFDDVKVTDELRTTVIFKQSKLAHYQVSDNLRLRIIDGDKFIREDIILKRGDSWVWNKVSPFSEKLKVSILKDNQAICTDYRANTKSGLTFYASDSLPLIRTPFSLSDNDVITFSSNDSEKKRLPIKIPLALENCRDKVLVVVFNKATNVLLWQYYGELRTDLTTDPIEYSKNVEGKIVRDEESCN